MIERLTAFFSKREMLKNMVVLTGGTAIAQAITFAASPILSRLFTEEEYGSYGIFTSVVSYFVVISCLRLEQAIVLPKDDQEGKSIAQWCIKLTVWVSTIVMLISLLGVFLFHIPIYFLLIAPTVFFMSLINVYNYYSSRIKRYKYNSNSKVIAGIFLVAVSILLGLLQFGEEGLILGMFVGQIVGGIYLFIVLNKEVYTVPNSLSWKVLKSKYRQFMFINTPNVLFDLTESAGVVLLLGLFFDKGYVGAYFFAFRILKVPLSLIGTSIYQVFYKEASESYTNENSIFPLFKNITGKLLVLSFPIFLLLFLFGQSIFIFVFGDEWSKAGHYASVFAPWFWLNFVASTVSCIPIIVNKQNLAFLLAFISTGIRLMVIFITGIYFTFEILVLAFAIIQPLIMAFNNYWYYYLAKKYGDNFHKI